MKNTFRKMFVSLAFALIFVSSALAQRVEGNVLDKNKEPIVGAVVMLKGNSSVATVTGMDGEFEITMPKGISDPVLEASCMGYKTAEVAVDNRTKIIITLEDQDLELDEAVVVGYGSMRKSDLTGSVTSVKVNEVEAEHSVSIDNLLKGHAAGVQVISDNASPDAGVTIRVRGMSTFNGNSEPLYVVDGIILNAVSNNESLLTVGSDNSGTDEAVNGLMGLNPQDIEHIEILKDASATAIYGALGANGVVLITTKMAKKDKPTVTFSAGVDVSNRYKKIDVLSFDEYVTFLEKQQAAGLSTGALLSNIYEDPASHTGLKVTPVDWQDYVFRTAYGQRYHFSISGRPKTMAYAFSVGYSEKQGIVRNSGLEQFTIRLNLDKHLSPKLKVGTKTNIGYVYSNQTQNSGKALSTTSLIRSVLSFRPYMSGVSAEEDEGDYDPESELNSRSGPDRWLNDFVNTRKEVRITPSIYGEYKISDKLTFKSTLGGDYRDNERVKFKSSRVNSTSEGSTGAVGTYRYFNWNFDNTLVLKDRLRGGHNITAMLGTSANTANVYAESVQGWNIEQFRALEKSINTAPNTSLSYMESRNSTLSFFTRGIYNYRDRYVLTATWRLDGSSKFRGANRWSSFPSAAFAWRLSEEPWFNSLTISQAKFRLGWGRVGNQAIANYQTISNFNNVSYADHSQGNSSEASIGLSPSNIANPDLKWETTEQTNVGLDLSLWKGRLSLAVDAYDKMTFDLLQERKIATSSGFSQMWMNEGSIRNRGLEFTLDATPVKTRNFEWNLGGNISFNRNTIVSMSTTATRGKIYISPEDEREVVYFLGESVGSSLYGNAAASIFMEGYPMGLFYGYKTDGIVQEGETGPAIVSGGAPAAPGHLKMVDTNGNGYIDEYDRTIIGNPNPDFTFGLNTSLSWKNLSLSVSALGSVGNDIINVNNMRETDSQSINHNVLRSVLYDSWTPENPGAKYWAIGSISSTETRAVKDVDIEDGSFLRISNVSLSYAFPINKKKSRVVKGLSVGVTGSNLYILTSYSGWDPEVNSFGKNVMKMGADAGSYPSSRTISCDVKFTF